MSDSETNRAKSEEERIKLLNELIRERFGDWATRKDVAITKNQEVSR